MKHCNKCQKSKSLEAFSKKAKSVDGLQAYCKECCYANKKMWAARNGNKTFWNRVWNRHRLRPDELNAMLASQNNSCKICSVSIALGKLHIDHDHACCPEGKSCASCRRGLLCQTCNHAVGWYEAMHDAERTKHIKKYLDKT